ncbi:hypothetical protein [Nocardioides sp. YIM 152588]|uniref:alpha/beta hydrolase family protein n=1 Tax=Nocardioides sp. YIM 152588 TaxID=3158259 RepID=UPI0032E44870
MSTVRRVLGRSIRAAGRGALVAGVAGVVLVGLVAQSAAYLLGYAAPTADGAAERAAYVGLDHAAPGPHRVGVRRIGSDDAPMDLTVWYPAVGSTDDAEPLTYSYALTALGGTATALATYEGRGRLGAAPDLARGPYPLVLLSAGFAITPESYAWLAEHLASHGLVVAAPAHPETLDPRTLWRSTIERPAAVARARAYLEAEARPGGDLAGSVDPRRVAVIGHSYGGYTALASGGARLDADAFAAGCVEARATDDPLVFLCDALEPRMPEVVAATGNGGPAPEPVDAVVSLAGDAAMFGGAGLAGVTAPVLTVGGTGDDDSPFRWSTRLAYEGVASVRKAEVALEGAAHFVFTGECDRARRVVALVPNGFCGDPAWDRARARAVVRHYVAAFLLAELGGDGSARGALAPRRGSPEGVGYRAVGY